MNKPRLIDANKLMEYIVSTPSKVMNEIPYEQTMFTNIQNRVNEILDAIDNQPTAYDIDNVVEQLEEFYRENECEMNNGFIEVCIDIVKGGAD
jgi:hypothetical protein